MSMITFNTLNKILTHGKNEEWKINGIMVGNIFLKYKKQNIWITKDWKFYYIKSKAYKTEYYKSIKKQTAD